MRKIFDCQRDMNAPMMPLHVGRGLRTPIGRSQRFLAGCFAPIIYAQSVKLAAAAVATVKQLPVGNWFLNSRGNCSRDASICRSWRRIAA